MNKYLRASICEMISICKFGLLKIEKGKKFNCKLINLVSPLTEVTVDKGGSLYIGNKFRMRSGAKIRVRKNASISIGKNFSMSNNCVITAWEKIEIGDDVQFGPNVLVYDQDHDLKVSPAHAGGRSARH